MGDIANPALFHRQAIREVCRGFVPPAGGDEMLEFQRWLTEMYVEAKQNHFLEISRYNTEKLEIFISAAGLLTYGDLDKAVDVLDYMPETPRNIRRIAGVVKVMLPLPESLEPIRDKDAVRTWIHENSLNLCWVEAEGKFVVTG